MISFPIPCDGELISGLIGRAIAYYGSSHVINKLLKTNISRFICDGRDLVIVGKGKNTTILTKDNKNKKILKNELYPYLLTT